MMPIDGPAPLPRCLDQVLSTARRARPIRPAPPLTWTGTTNHLDGAQLFAYWENLLDPEAIAEVEEHALDCEECWHWLLEIGKMFGK